MPHDILIFMGMNLASSRPVVRQRRKRLELLLLLSFFLCLLIGIGAFGALWWLRNAEPTVPLPSLRQSLRPAQISRPLALHQLSGDPAEALAYQAIAAGELDTAYAIVLYDSALTGGRRAALYQKLAVGLRAAGQMEQLAFLSRSMRATALLDPTLPTSERIQLLIQSIEGFLAAAQPPEALDAATQAMRMGMSAPDLLPAQRAEIFTRLDPLARQIADPFFTQQIDELLRNPFFANTGVALPTGLFMLSEPVETAPELAVATARRQLAAQALVARITALAYVQNEADFQAGIAAEQQELIQTLLAEDQLRRLALENTANTDISLNQQFAILQEYRNWSALKVRISSLGFGFSLVPEWEANRDALLQELATITRNLDTISEELINRQETDADKAAMRVEKLMWLALQSELGLYPNQPLDELGNQLRFAQDALAEQGVPLALRVLFDSTATPPGIRLQDNNVR